MAKTSLLLSISTLLALNHAQMTPLIPQTDTWNSTFQFLPSQLIDTNLSIPQTTNTEQALNFERTNWATSSISTDPFYTAPSNSSSLPPGSLLKLEPYTNPTNYTLPPNIAISRLLYTTQTLLNETVPASAIVLWPYLPLQYPNLTPPNPTINSSRFPLVSWLHGTSGVFSDCGPSHIRNIWYQYSAPFELALSGYVVVAPDYQGLGTNTTIDGTEIVHPYMSAPAAANDAFFSIQATQSAFPHLVSNEFVIMGHSQGGNAAWGAAIRQTRTPVKGYLGTIAGSPVTNLTSLISLLGSSVPPVLPLLLSQSLRSLFPDFNPSQFLTAQGLARFSLAKSEAMCNSAIGELLSDFPASDNGTLVHRNWTESPELQEYLSTSDIGNKPVAGPMLVLQGTDDPAVPVQFTDASVALTCAVSNNTGLTYTRFDGVTHVPVLFASRRIWLDFLRDRFETVGGSSGSGIGRCTTTNYSSLAMPVENYQKELGYFLSLATMGYQVA